MIELNEPQLNPPIPSLRISWTMAKQLAVVFQVFIFAFQGTVIIFTLDNTVFLTS